MGKMDKTSIFYNLSTEEKKRRFNGMTEKEIDEMMKYKYDHYRYLQF